MEDREDELNEEQSPSVPQQGPRALPYLDTGGNYDPSRRPQGPSYDFRTDSGIDRRAFISKATEDQARVFRAHQSERLQHGFDIAVENILGDLAVDSDWKPFKAFVDDLVRRNSSAYDTTPDAASEKAVLSERTGIFLDFLNDSEVLKNVKIREQMKKDAFALARAPHKLADWFRYPGALALARDDIEVFNALAGALASLAIKQGPPREHTPWERLKKGIGNVLHGISQRRESAAGGVGVDLRSEYSGISHLREAIESAGGLSHIDWGQKGVRDGLAAADFNQYLYPALTAQEKQRLNELKKKQLMEASKWWAEQSEKWTPAPALSSHGAWGYLMDVVEGLPYTFKSMGTTAGLALLLGGPAGLALGTLISANDEAETEQASVYIDLA
jgi:hypothetical protein